MIHQFKKESAHATAAALCILLLLAVALVFGRTAGYGFVNYDDGPYVFENPQVSAGLTFRGAARAFTTMPAGNWHPLTWLSHMLDVQLFGLHPAGHHLMSVGFHAASAILLFVLLWRMTGSLWRSAFVAAVFALHPLRVESVAWVAERKDVLSGFFFMLTLLAYVRYARRPFSWGRYGAVAGLFALGLMSKPMVVTLPLVLLLLDYWPLGRLGLPPDRETMEGAPAQVAVQESPNARFARTEARGAYGNRSSTPAPAKAGEGCGATRLMGVLRQPGRVIMEKVPLLLLSAASCAVTLVAQGDAVMPMDVMPLASRLANAAVSYMAYIGKLFYPSGLAVFYPHPEGGLPMGQVVLSALAVAGITLMAVLWRRRFPYLLVGWLWYVGMLVPVIGLVQVGSQSMADRYTYLPQIGLVVAVTWGFARLVSSWRDRRGVAVGVAVSALVILLLMGLSWRQVSHWRNSETLWTHALECTTRNFVAHNNIGNVLKNRGRIDEALFHYGEALEIKPYNSEGYNNVGNALWLLGRIDAAVIYYRRALQIDPDYAEAHNNLGIALAYRGEVAPAVVHFTKALEKRPDFTEAHNNLGIALANLGEMEEAVAHFRKALEINPNDAGVRKNLDRALRQGGHGAPASGPAG